ncbi:hypothetical protein, partial [Rhizobium tubonense]|uniref:hypothetical protein n=1 Tax=Rhizobium tubonense TaxID=484088 RepID=UPI0019D4897A
PGFFRYPDLGVFRNRVHKCLLAKVGTTTLCGFRSWAAIGQWYWLDHGIAATPRPIRLQVDEKSTLFPTFSPGVKIDSSLASE